MHYVIVYKALSDTYFTRLQISHEAVEQVDIISLLQGSEKLGSLGKVH